MPVTSARSALPAFAAALALVATATAAVPPIAAAVSPERFTPVTATVVAPPRPVAAADGRRHLAYELLLVNRSFNPPAGVTVQRVEALAGGRVVASLSGPALAAVMLPFGGTQPGVQLAKGEAASVTMDVSFPPGARLPARLDHRLTIAPEPANPVVATTYRAAATPVSRRQAVVVSPPLRGDGWIVGNGCCADLTSHRGALLPVNGGLHEGERFAIDFMQVMPSGLLATGPFEELASYPFFGDPVVAAAAGRVVTAVDGLPETPPGAVPPMTAAGAAGNHVVVDMGHGRFALYAHLQPGSVRVTGGDRVRVGQTLGLLGSSGSSNAPHLHFQVMDGPDPLGSDGIPYRFDRFSVAGTLTNFGGLFDGEKANVSPRLRGEHRRQLPLDLQVIGFGGAPR